eukprot:4901957-Pleurochrysis_carterae.AAC.3
MDASRRTHTCTPMYTPTCAHASALAHVNTRACTQHCAHERIVAQPRRGTRAPRGHTHAPRRP